MSATHAHDHGHPHGHGHSHGLVDQSIKRSREGLRAVGLSLVVLALTAAAQVLVYLLTDSVALLADLIHNFGDAATAIPLGVAFSCARHARNAPQACSWWPPSSSPPASRAMRRSRG